MVTLGIETAFIRLLVHDLNPRPSSPVHKSINFSQKPESPETLADTSFGGVDHHGQAGKNS